MRNAVICTLSLIAFASAARAADTLDVKAGLWETTTSLQLGAPSQNANPTVRRQCLSQKDVEKAFSQLDQNPNCKRTVVTATPQLNESTIVCGGQMQGEGKLRIDAPDPEHVTGYTEITMGPLHLNATFQGKWLSADCGATKPKR